MFNYGYFSFIRGFHFPYTLHVSICRRICDSGTASMQHKKQFSHCTTRSMSDSSRVDINLYQTKAKSSGKEVFIHQTKIYIICNNKRCFGILLHKQKCFIRSKKIPSPSGFLYLKKHVLRVLNGLKYSSIFNSCFDQS